MNCKNCGTIIDVNDKFCPNCGMEIKKENSSKTPPELSNTSIKLFSIILIINIITFIFYFFNDSGISPLFIILLIFLMGIPCLISVILGIVSFFTIIKYKKQGVPVPEKMDKFKIINLCQLPIIILVFVLGIGLKEFKYTVLANQKLHDIYNSNYKILKS